MTVEAKARYKPQVAPVGTKIGLLPEEEIRRVFRKLAKPTR